MAKSLASFNKVSKFLNTLMLLSTNLECCSFCCLGLILPVGHELFIEMLLNDACASVIISSSWLYLMKSIESAEMSDLLLRSLQGKQKKQSTPNTRARLTQSLERVLLRRTRMLILSMEILEKNVDVASNFFICTLTHGSVKKW